MEPLKVIVNQHASADAKIALFRSLFRGRDESIRVDLRAERREIRVRAGMRQRMGARHLREAANQVC